MRVFFGPKNTRMAVFSSQGEKTHVLFHRLPYAVEMGLSEQQLRRSTGFIIGILSRG